MWFLIIFLPFVYLFLKQKWFAGVINLILCIISISTILLFGIGILFWLLAVVQASYHYRKYELNEHAKDIAREMNKGRNI